MTLRRSPGAHPRVDPAHRRRVSGAHGGVDEQPLERMVEIPVIDDVLVVPDDLAGVGVERQRRVVVEVLLVVAAEHELRRRRRHRRADVDQVQLRDRSSAPSTCRRASASRTARRPRFRCRARPASESSRVRHSSLPVFASCAVMTQASGPPSGSQLRPEITLPLAMIGPELCCAPLACSRGSSFPRPACPVVRVEREDVVVRAGVDDVGCRRSRGCG